MRKFQAKILEEYYIKFVRSDNNPDVLAIAHSVMDGVNFDTIEKNHKTFVVY